MPTTYTSFVIGIKGSTALTAKEYVKVTNHTSGGTIRGQAISGGDVKLNPANFQKDWSDGDTISIEISGVTLGSASTTLSKGGAQKTVTVGTTAGPTIAI